MTEAPLRIAFVVNSLIRGGAEVQVVDLATTLASRGHEVRVVTLLPEVDETMLARLTIAGVSFVTLGMSDKRDVALAVGRYIRALRAFRPDVVHAHLFASNLLARLGRLGVPRHRLVETTHTPRERGKLRYRLYRSTARFGGVWTCVCQDGIDAHVRAGAFARGHLVRNGVRTVVEIGHAREETRARLRRELEVEKASFLWLSVGSFRNEQKDFGNLLDAFARVRRDVPGARLAIAGDGQLLGEKRRRATELGVRDQVRFLGLRTDVLGLMAAADGFALASLYEALPIVLLEAASSSLPIVATDVGDVRAIVSGDALGRTVPISDPSALATAMLAVMRLGEQERRQMGERLREHAAAQYDLDVIVDRWERVYRGGDPSEAFAPGSFVQLRSS